MWERERKRKRERGSEKQGFSANAAQASCIDDDNVDAAAGRQSALHIHAALAADQARHTWQERAARESRELAKRAASLQKPKMRSLHCVAYTPRCLLPASVDAFDTTD